MFQRLATVVHNVTGGGEEYHEMCEIKATTNFV